jgi:ABC-2 type transport system permease protein
MAPATMATTPAPETLKPSFLGVLRGELIKMSRLRVLWIMLILLVGVLLLPWLGSLGLANAKVRIDEAPLLSLMRNVSGNLGVLRVFTGFILIILTAQVIGLDYQQGTIRIVLARGVERLQLLAAKVVAILSVAALMLVGGLILEYAAGLLYYQLATGNLDVLNAASPAFWADVRIAILTIIINMLVTVALTMAATVLGRSVAVGMTVGLSFFAADNIGTLVMLILNRVTNNDFWLNLTGYFLGPNLNVLAGTWIAPLSETVTTEQGHATIQATFFNFGSGPLVSYDLTHVLTVIAIYAVVFIGLAVGLTSRRDVLE